jgi:hypothetical protein
MAEGTEARLWNRSVLRYGTWQTSHDDVPRYRWASKSATVPAPMAEAMMSGAPVTTWAVAGRPRAAAASGRSGPRTVALGTRSGSLSRSSPAMRSRRSS